MPSAITIAQILCVCEHALDHIDDTRLSINSIALDIGKGGNSLARLVSTLSTWLHLLLLLPPLLP